MMSRKVKSTTSERGRLATSVAWRARRDAGRPAILGLPNFAATLRRAIYQCAATPLCIHGDNAARGGVCMRYINE